MDDKTWVPPELQIPAQKQGEKSKWILGGQYVLKSSLGQGSMGHVYLAWDTALQREVAIKVTEKPLSRHTRDTIVSKILHANIITLYHYCEQSGRGYLIMEYVPGGDLFQWVRQHGPMSWSQALPILRQASVALAYLHTQGIVHADLKPGNILISNQGLVKICDFGLSYEGISSPHSYTNAYGCPPKENLPGKSADVYSLGMVYYFLLTGKQPRPPLDWGQFPRSVPDEMVKLLAGLAQNPVRYINGDEFERHLQKALAPKKKQLLLRTVLAFLVAFLLSLDSVKHGDMAWLIRYARSPEPNPRVVLVDVENPRIQTNEMHRLCQALALILQGGPKGIALDIFFSPGSFSLESPENRNLDSLLRPFASKITLLSRLKPRVSPSGAEEYDLEKPAYEALPTGFGNLESTDGRVQHLPLYYDVGGGALELSFSLKAVVQFLGPGAVRISGHKLHFFSPAAEYALDGDRLWLSHPGALPDLKIVPISQIFAFPTEQSRSLFADKLVVIGLVNPTESADNHATSLGLQKGVAIQTAAIQQLLARHVWMPWPWAGRAIAMGLLFFIAAHLSGKRWIGLLLGGYLLYIAATLFFFHALSSIPPVFPGIAAIVMGRLCHFTLR